MRETLRQMVAAEVAAIRAEYTRRGWRPVAHAERALRTATSDDPVARMRAHCDGLRAREFDYLAHDDEEVELEHRAVALCAGSQFVARRIGLGCVGGPS